MIRGVKFVSIPVADQERALKFYTEKLGFRLLTDQPFSDKQRWIELGIPGADTRVVLFQFSESLQPGGVLNIALWADDVEATARALQECGVEFVMQPKKFPYGMSSVFKDSEGNRLLLGSKRLQFQKRKRATTVPLRGPGAANVAESGVWTLM